MVFKQLNLSFEKVFLVFIFAFGALHILSFIMPGLLGAKIRSVGLGWTVIAMALAVYLIYVIVVSKKLTLSRGDFLAILLVIALLGGLGFLVPKLVPGVFSLAFDAFRIGG